MSRRLRLAAAFAAGAVVLTGCGFKGAYSIPLPGGAAHGKTYHVTAIFSDVQDLTPQAAVRVNDVAVGDVTSINLGTVPGKPGYLKANVGLRINATTKLPANSIATLEQTTLLGEKFVSIEPPTNVAPEGTLANGAVIANGSTSELPNVEEVFGLLSQVLNGSDLEDLQTINIEVSKALAGREADVRGALTQLNTFVTGLDHQKSQIVRALDQLDRFSGALAKQDGTIATALTELGPGLRVLANERAQFTSLLTDLSTFGKVATHVIQASKAQTITGLHDLEPILHHLAAAGADLPHSLEILVTFPFPRDSSQASPGDYTNFAVQSLDVGPILCAAFANFSATELLTLLTADSGTLDQLLGVSTSQLLTGGGCPSAGTSSATKAPATSGTPTTPGTSTGTTPTTTPTPTTGTVPSPSPSPSGLAKLLNGLAEGGGS